LALHAQQASAAAGRPRLFSSSEFVVRDDGRKRRIDYSDGAVSLYDFSTRRGELFCANAERLHELAYLCILSRAGEELDRRGMHRVHALGFEFRGSGGLLLLPSGGGKSVLALELLAASPELGVLSDDTPLLVAGGRLRAFPLRWGFLPSADLSSVPDHLIRPFVRKRYGPKRVVDVGYFRSRIKDDVPLKWLLAGSRVEGEPRMEPLSFAGAMSALAINLVVGHGVAQMAEYRLRSGPADVAGLAAHALSRLRSAIGAARSPRRMRFALGPDPKRSARALVAYLEGK